MTVRSRIANQVLARIPARDYRRLRDHLEPVRLNFGQVLYDPGKTIRHVYFPLDCLISLLTVVDVRRTLEVGMVGNEGMAGMPFILGMGVSGVRALVQGGGNALCMASAPFRIEFSRNHPLQQALYRYTYALMAQISQTAACNRFHAAEARLARWLLMTRDRVELDDFPLTHEFLAHMLGLRREGVSEAASALKQRHLIDLQPRPHSDPQPKRPQSGVVLVIRSYDPCTSAHNASGPNRRSLFCALCAPANRAVCACRGQ